MRTWFTWLSLGLAMVLTSSGLAEAISFQPPGGNTHISKRVVSLREARYKNVIPQKFDVSCGAAALATIMKYFYGHDEITNEQEIVREMLITGAQEKIKAEGFSLLDLKKYAEGQGYSAQGYKLANADKLDKLDLPFITLVNIAGYSHFVVIKKVSGGRVFIADPAFGNRSMSLAELSKAWNNIVFVVLSKSRQGRFEFAMKGLLTGPKNEVIRLQDLGIRTVFPGAGEF